MGPNSTGLQRHLCSAGRPSGWALAHILVTVARDRDSDSERLLYFGRVIFIYLLQSPAIAIAIARDCYILVVLFFFIFLFFFSVHQIFAVPGPIFTKLYHTTRYVLK